MACKNPLFGVQKVGFCIAKVWFLFFECCVVAIRQQRFGNLYATLWQSIRSIIGRLSAAVGVRFIAPVSTNTPKLYCVFMPLALQFASFRHIKTIWVGLKNGHDESAPIPYVLFVAIHLRNKWIFAYCSLLYILHHKQMVWCVRWCVYLCPFTMPLV